MIFKEFNAKVLSGGVGVAQVLVNDDGTELYVSVCDAEDICIQVTTYDTIKAFENNTDIDFANGILESYMILDPVKWKTRKTSRYYPVIKIAKNLYEIINEEV